MEQYKKIEWNHIKKKLYSKLTTEAFTTIELNLLKVYGTPLDHHSQISLLFGMFLQTQSMLLLCHEKLFASCLKKF